MLLPVKSNAIATFVLPKSYIYVARHANISKADIKRSQHLISNALWGSNKHDVAEKYAAQNPRNGGRNLPILLPKIIAAKLKDWMAVNLQTMNKEYLPQNTTDLLQACKISFRRINERIQFLDAFSGSLLLTKHTTTKTLQQFLLSNYYSNDGIYDRLSIPAESFNWPEQTIKLFLQSQWPNECLPIPDKTLLYRLAFGALQNKQERWMHNLTEHPLCAYCSEEFETTDSFSSANNYKNFGNSAGCKHGWTPSRKKIHSNCVSYAAPFGAPTKMNL